MFHLINKLCFVHITIWNWNHVVHIHIIIDFTSLSFQYSWLCPPWPESESVVDSKESIQLQKNPNIVGYNDKEEQRPTENNKRYNRRVIKINDPFLVKYLNFLAYFCQSNSISPLKIIIIFICDVYPMANLCNLNKLINFSLHKTDKNLTSLNVAYHLEKFRDYFWILLNIWYFLKNYLLLI